MKNDSINPILQMKGISKHYGGMKALSNVDLDLHRGSIHGIVGENGAGKSTLVKIISGALIDYEGGVFLNGERVRFSSPRDAQKKGVGIVYQELSVINCLTVAENIFLGVQPVKGGIISWNKMKEDAQNSLAEFGFSHVDVQKPLSHHRFSIKQTVEIVKVLRLGAQIIIMDEPTSGLSRDEIITLSQILEKLKADGKSIIYISHHLDEVLQFCDTITILRDGKKVDTISAEGCNKRTLVEKILGEKGVYLSSREDNFSVLLRTKEEVEKLNACLKTERLTVSDEFEDVNFEVHSGEALGLYGLVGSGYSSVGECLYGLFPEYNGSIHIENKQVNIDSPVTAKKVGIGYVPEDRSIALVFPEPIYKNITLPYLSKFFKRFFLKFILRIKEEISAAQNQIDSLNIKTPNALMPVGSLSGGNMQKVSLGRWLTFQPKILILSEPTRGVDVGAKVEIISFIRELKKEAVMGLIIISTEPETIMELSDRIMVFSRGKIVAELSGESVSMSRLMEIAS
ncbi:MAG: sugar ABC transporter ATP-binding protein [Desulfobacteraceae bacterium]|nr:sugar ABC transporter ATP-binding protein [Desulfobacteraceae bacterium]